MSRVISAKAWGGARLDKDGKIKVWKRAKDASQKRRWASSKKVTAISRKAAARYNKP